MSDRYVETSNYDSNIYAISFKLVDPVLESKADPNNIEYWLDEGDKIAFMVNSNNTSSETYVKITGTLDSDLTSVKSVPSPWTLHVYDASAHDIAPNTILKDKVYIFVFHKILKVFDNSIQNADGSYGAYIEHSDCLTLSGSTQAYGYYEETNPECPYSTTSLGYKIPQRIVMETDYTDDLCFNRAERMTYESCAMKDTITLNTLIIPWLDVNERIAYVSQYSKDRDTLLTLETTEQPQYMINNLSWSTTDGTMSITAYRYREDFQWVWDRAHKNGGNG